MTLKPQSIPLTRDKQLRDISLESVLEKRRLEQALNMKEFAVLAGVSYSVARDWFQLPGFPRLEGVVFWNDFVSWRNDRNSNKTLPKNLTPETASTPPQGIRPIASGLPSRAAKILLESAK